jgi:PleD family two-component response regulator
LSSFAQVHEVLLIDDDGVDRQNIRRILAPVRNINITEAHSGEHAMQILENLEPALVITDIFMPDVDGLEFLTQLATKGITFPVIAITGLNDSKYVDFLKVAQNFGAVYSMEKKDMERDLARVAHEILSGRLESSHQYHPYC